MQVLLIDTSAQAVCVAIGSSKEDAVDISLNEKSRHGENLFQVISDVFNQSNIDMKQVQAIGVGVGPGSFTGLRIGIIAAHTLAHALDIPLVYMSSLELMALSANAREGESEDASEEIVVYRDARRKEYYTATFSMQNQNVHEEVVDGVKIASMLNRVEAEHLIPYYDVNLEDPEQVEAMAKDLKLSNAIYLVQQAVSNSIVANTFGAQAIYIRKSDAELSWNIKK